MSVARFSPTSDVYVFPTGPGSTNYCCASCRLTADNSSYFSPSAQAMIAHLEEHLDAGHKVEDDVISELRYREKFYNRSKS